MPRIRILASVAAAAIAGTLLGASIDDACNDRSTTACQRALSPPGPSSEAFDRRSSKTHRGRRIADHLDPSPNVSALSVRMQPDRDNGTFAQQFQRFVSKQSITATTAEELRSPWLEPAQLALTSAHPVSGGIIAASDGDVANNLKHPTVNEVALDDHHDINDENHRAVGERRTVGLQSRASDSGPLSVSWVALGFLVWGALLTVGSGLRLIFG
jgi:hypothetical protein